MLHGLKIAQINHLTIYLPTEIVWDVTVIQNTTDYLPVGLGQKIVGQVTSCKAPDARD
jgi:hypothetical protein